MRIYRDISKSWEMLQASHHLTAGLEPIQIGSGHLDDLRSGGTKHAAAQISHSVRDILHIDNWRQIGVDAQTVEFLSVLLAALAHVTGIVTVPHLFSGGQWTLDAVQPIDRTTL